MSFTVEQYDEAIKALQAAKQQVISDEFGNGCAICGGSCHPDQCGFNPLYAMHLCRQIANQSEELHTSLHYLAGYETHMGETHGPGSVVVPDKDKKIQARPGMSLIDCIAAGLKMDAEELLEGVDNSESDATGDTR